MAVARIFNKLLFRTRRFFSYPCLIIDSLLYFKDLICISTVHLYRPLCLIILSLTCSALGCLMNMWTFRPPARWAHGLLLWPRTAIINVVFCLVKRLSLFLYCLSEIKFTTTTTFPKAGDGNCARRIYQQLKTTFKLKRLQRTPKNIFIINKL